MKNIICLLLIAVAPSLGLWAQETLKYNGADFPATMYEFNASPDVVESAIKEKFLERGYRAEETKGFLVYRSAKADFLGIFDPKDYVIEIKGQGKKREESSEVRIIVADPGTLPAKRLSRKSAVPPIGLTAISTAAIANGFGANVNTQQYFKELSLQEALVAKEEKKLTDLEGKAQDLQKKLADIQKNIEDNTKEQQQQVEEIAKQKAALELLRNRGVGEKAAGN